LDDTHLGDELEECIGMEIGMGLSGMVESVISEMQVFTVGFPSLGPGDAKNHERIFGE